MTNAMLPRKCETDEKSNFIFTLILTGLILLFVAIFEPHLRVCYLVIAASVFI